VSALQDYILATLKSYCPINRIHLFFTIIASRNCEDFVVVDEARLGGVEFSLVETLARLHSSVSYPLYIRLYICTYLTRLAESSVLPYLLDQVSHHNLLLFYCFSHLSFVET
jgi:hypothetical protein